MLNDNALSHKKLDYIITFPKNKNNVWIIKSSCRKEVLIKKTTWATFTTDAWAWRDKPPTVASHRYSFAGDTLLCCCRNISRDRLNFVFDWRCSAKKKSGFFSFRVQLHPRSENKETLKRKYLFFVSIGLSATGDVKAYGSLDSDRGVRFFLWFLVVEAVVELINMFIVIYERRF